MKKVILIILLLPGLLYSQDFKEFQSENYTYKTTLNDTDITDYTQFAETINLEFNRLLDIKNNLKSREIVILADRVEYNEYLNLLGISKRDDFIFLKYSDGRSRVVIYREDEINYRSFAHHLTLQYIFFYGGETPEWFSEGLAVYFESFNADGSFNQENSWLPFLKSAQGVERIYTTILKKDEMTNNPGYSWVVIDYLINSKNREHNRLLWDSLSLLQYGTNSDKKSLFTSMYSAYNLDNEIKEYILSRKGYEDYMESGVQMYKEEKYKDAQDYFKMASELEPDKYSPIYYLGLCSSRLNEYHEAYSYFSTALDYGAPVDIVYYSIGLNFYSSDDFNEAKKYLNKIEDELYKVMAEKVLNEISKY